jgi:hypothetical protein
MDFVLRMLGVPTSFISLSFHLSSISTRSVTSAKPRWLLAIPAVPSYTPAMS